MRSTGKRRRSPGSFCLLADRLARPLREQWLTGAREPTRQSAARGEKVCCFKRLGAHVERKMRPRAPGKFGLAPGALCRACARDFA